MVGEDRAHEWVLSLFVFLLVYGLYHVTSFPSVTGGDSGELLAEACQLGTAHPPGYPAFTMLFHLATMIPVPRLTIQPGRLSTVMTMNTSPAWKANNLCCLLGAFTAVLIWASSTIVLKACNAKNATILSTIGAFGYALAPLVWEYSITAEVFALNNFMCAVLIYLTCRVLSAVAKYKQAADNAQDDDNKCAQHTILESALMGGLFCGLAMANQHSSMLLVAYVVPCLVLSVWTLAPHLIMGVMLRSATGFLVGFSTYMYLPWAAGRPTPGSWGQVGTVAGFMKHVLRAEYGTFRLGMIVGSETWYQRIAIYLQHTSEESLHLLFPLLAVGVASCLFATAMLEPMRSSNQHSATPNTKDSKKASIPKHLTKKVVTKEVTAVTASDRITSGAARMLVGNLVGMWLFYTLIWHCVLSNLPLSAPMPFAVHSRFWMQPNLVLYVLLGVAVGKVGDFATAQPAKMFAGTVQVAVVVLYLSVVVFQRYPMMDKSSTGGVLQSYAAALMASIMPNYHALKCADPSAATVPHVRYHSLLLSHTDLDWNPVRYLQHCEGLGMEHSAFYRKSPLAKLLGHLSPQPAGGDLVTQLSFQLIPYPWFEETQQPLYPHVVFPSTKFAGVSTDRASEGNAQLILRFLRANSVHNATYTYVPRPQSQEGGSSDRNPLPVVRSTHDIFPGGVYLDMQAVHEAEIDAMGQWRGLFLVPWGTVYRVFGPLGVQQIMELHHHSMHHLQALQRTFPAVDDTFALKFAPGSWERAAANVYYDAHYQFGLNLLTFAIELQTNVNMKLMPLLMDRYYQSASVLRLTLSAVHKYGTFSSSVADLSKNTALAWMRLAALMDIVSKFHKEVSAEFKTLPANALLNWTAAEHLLSKGAPAEVRAAAKAIMEGFLREYPGDKDAKVFAAALAKLL